MDMKKGLASLPLYRLYLEDFRVFGDMPVEAFAVGEAQDAFAAFMMQEDNDLPAFIQQQINDIRLIQERYAGFLDRDLFQGDTEGADQVDGIVVGTSGCAEAGHGDTDDLFARI